MYGEPTRKPRAAIIAYYAAASVLGGALLGLAASGIGVVVDLDAGRWLAVVALSMSLHDARLVRLPIPQSNWQVPAQWRAWHSPRALAAAYGFILGSGVATRVMTAAYYTLILLVVVVGDVSIGLIIGAVYGLARAAPVLYLPARYRTHGEAAAAFDRVDRIEPAVRMVAAMILAAIGGMWVSWAV